MGMKNIIELERIKFLSKQIEEVADRLLSGNKTPITVLNLSSRVKNALYRSDIKYLEQLLKMSEDDLIRVRNMGEGSLNEIKEKVRALGFDFL
jgi:DNA-directed RNA polymerase alpha subunit